MSTVLEIEAAIEQLPAGDREVFESRLIARRFGLDESESAEYSALLTSIDEAEQEIDAGQGVNADALRRKLAGWAGQ